MVSTLHITNAIIEEISSDNNTNFVTISYMDPSNRRRTEQTVRLVVGRNTSILDENGNFIPFTSLTSGMTVNVVFSSAMTRSNPPQASAFMIRVVNRPISDSITFGRILNIDRQNRSFTVIDDGNLSSVIRFNVPADALIFDRGRRPINFSWLIPGMRVRVRHASFMTASIPPQTTAFEVRVL